MEFETINITKIRDGIYISDRLAGSNIDIITQFKISHILNVAGYQMPLNFESLGIKYLNLNWLENPSPEVKYLTDESINKIINFFDDCKNNGEGLLGYSFKGQNRICVIIIIFLMKKYNWTLQKCIDFLKRKKNDVAINKYYMEQLRNFEEKLYDEIQPSANWAIQNLKNDEEILLRNTYINGLEIPKFTINSGTVEKNRLLRHVGWGDNKKYIKQMQQTGLVHYNLDKDLYLQKNINDVTVHLNTKPFKPSIKNTNTKNKKTAKLFLGINNMKSTENLLTTENDNSNNNNNGSVKKNSKNEKKQINSDGFTVKHRISDKIAIDSIKKEKNDENDSENLKENKPNNIIEKTLVKNNNNLNKILTQNLNNDKKNKEENKKDIQDDEEEKIKLSIINMERFKEFKKNRELSKNQEKEKEKKKRKSSTPEPIINNELIINDGSLKPLLDTLIKKGSDVNTLNSYLKKKRGNKNFDSVNNLNNLQYISNIRHINLNAEPKKKPETLKTNEQISPDLNGHNESDTNSFKEKISSTTTINNINIININKANFGIINGNKKINNYLTENNNTYSIYFDKTGKRKNSGKNNNSKHNKNKHKNNIIPNTRDNNHLFINSNNVLSNKNNNNNNKQKYFSPNTNYILPKPDHFEQKEKEKEKEYNNTIPKLMPNHNMNNTNNNNNIADNANNKNQTKIFIRPTININKNDINNVINSNRSNLINDITNFQKNGYLYNNYMPVKNKNKRSQTQNNNPENLSNIDFNLIKNRSNNLFNNRFDTTNNKPTNIIYSNRNIPIKNTTNNKAQSSDKINKKSKITSATQNFNTSKHNSKKKNTSQSNSYSKKKNTERPTTAPQNNMPKISSRGVNYYGKQNFGNGMGLGKIMTFSNGFNVKFMGNTGTRGFSGPNKRLQSPVVYATQTSGFSGKKNNGKYRLSSPMGGFGMMNKVGGMNNHNIVPLKKKY